jgi:ribosomal protein L34E
MSTLHPKTKTPQDTKSYYPFEKTLCVLPTDGEAQYEAFQSILAAIMYANTVTPKEVSQKSPYELLCNNYDITLKSYTGSQLPHKEGPALNAFFNKIYPNQIGGVRTRTRISKSTKIKPTKTTRTNAKKLKKEEKFPKCAICFKNKSSTHYIGLCRKSEKENVKMYNPYASVQVDNSEGFCQMFAFFLVTDPSLFIDVDQRTKINVNEFNKLASNTKKCFDKIQALLSLPKNANVLAKFQQEFDNLPNKDYGIKPGTTCTQYLADFSKINSDLNAVKYYIYDQPLKDWVQGFPKEELWNSFNTKDAPDYKEVL